MSSTAKTVVSAAPTPTTVVPFRNAALCINNRPWVKVPFLNYCQARPIYMLVPLAAFELPESELANVVKAPLYSVSLIAGSESKGYYRGSKQMKASDVWKCVSEDSPVSSADTIVSVSDWDKEMAKADSVGNRVPMNVSFFVAPHAGVILFCSTTDCQI